MAKEILRSYDFKGVGRINNLPEAVSTDQPVTLAQLERLSSAGFDAAQVWYFNSTDEGWTPSNCLLVFDSANGKGLKLTDNSSAVGSIANSPAGLTLSGNLYRKVKMSVTLITPGVMPASAPNLQYTTSGHGFSASFRKIISYPTKFTTAGDTAILDFDMETSDNPTDWQTSTITQIRILLTDTVTTGMELRINWVAVGREAPVNIVAGSGNVNQASASSAAGKLKLSAGADRTIADYSGVSSVVAVDSAGSAIAGVPGTHFFPPATNASVDNGEIILLDNASPVTPPANSVKFTSKPEVSLSLPFILNRKGQRWRVKLQGRTELLFQSASNSTLLTAHQGLLMAATGTATAVALSNTSRYTRIPKVEALVTTPATTAVAGFRCANACMFTGAGTVDGGYLMRLTGGPATGVGTTTSRFWMGTGQTAAPTDVEPSAINNTIGAGYDAADTNIQIITKGTGTVAKTDTGIAVPTTDRSALYEIIIYQPPGATQEAYILFTDLINGTTFSKIETTAGNLPATGIALTPKIYSSAGGTSSVIGVALASVYVTTDF